MKRNKDKYSYIKFIAIIDIIIKNSDEKHHITVKDIQEELYKTKYEFSIDYRLIDKYVNYYNDYYDDTIIQSYKSGRNKYYYFTHNQLDIMEAKAIVDLVYSSNFFTSKIKENYKKRIQDMFSLHYCSYFDKKLNPHIDKNKNDKVFYQELELIASAINRKKEIKFIYSKPSLINKSTKIYQMAPIDTCFANNEYYLLCQGNKNKEECISFRLDYVIDVEIIEDSHIDFNPIHIQSFTETLKTMTYMYGEGNDEYIELDFDKSVYPNMIDKFGKDIKPRMISDNIYRVQVKSRVNSTFYSWIIGFGGKIQIASCDIKQKEKFNDFLKKFI